MKLNLGLESLVGRPANNTIRMTMGDVYRHFVETDNLYNECMTLNDSINNAITVRACLEKYGRTQSLEFLVGHEALEMISTEGWWQTTWEAIKKFFARVWAWIKKMLVSLHIIKNTSEKVAKAVKESAKVDKPEDVTKEMVEKAPEVVVPPTPIPKLTEEEANAAVEKKLQEREAAGENVGGKKKIIVIKSLDYEIIWWSNFDSMQKAFNELNAHLKDIKDLIDGLKSEKMGSAKAGDADAFSQLAQGSGYKHEEALNGIRSRLPRPTKMSVKGDQLDKISVANANLAKAIDDMIAKLEALQKDIDPLILKCDAYAKDATVKKNPDGTNGREEYAKYAKELTLLKDYLAGMLAEIRTASQSAAAVSSTMANSIDKAIRKRDFQRKAIESGNAKVIA